ncbi:MAG: alginate lyase family protein, partial [Gammaproteobacteria bacterium]
VRFYLSSEPGSEEDFSLDLERKDRARAQAGVGKKEFSVKRYLEEGPAHRFYLPSPGGREKMARFFAHTFPRWTESAVEQAERLCRHRVEILGHGEIDLGAEIDWHKDPVTGRTWLRRYWADYDPVRDCSAGDPKRVHELNRHQHLSKLAKAYYLTGEERYAREAIAQIESWIQQNPKSLGINWQSSLEIGLRAISWIWTLFFLLPSKSLDERAARRISRSLFAQLDHVYRYPSIFSSPNTHLIGEAAALFMAGVLFSELKRGAAWREMGASLLVQEMERQVLSAGIHAEFSPYYHCYALDFYLQALALARRNRIALPDSVWSRSGRMLDFLMHVTRPDGSIPLIGDDDGGRALALGRTDYGTFRDALCTGALLLGRPDFKHQAGEFCEETLWLLGEEAWTRFGSMRGVAPSGRVEVYRAAGYLIHRSGWGKEDSHLVFKCGGFGTLGGGHSHADALSLVLFAGSKELLVDPGAYVYNCAPDWRAFFRSTRAHNTVVVDEMDQSEAGGTFGWYTRAVSREMKHRVFSEGVYAEGEHDGYGRLPGGIIHTRRVLSLASGCAIVVDECRGEGEHRYDLYHHFCPEAELTLRGGPERGRSVELTARIGETGALLFVCASGTTEAQTVAGQTAPIQGWVSRRYGEKQAAPVLRASLRSAAPAAFLSFVAPLEPSDSAYSARELEVKGGPGLAGVLEHRGLRDIAVVSLGESELELDDFTLRGGFFWLRMEEGIPKRLLAFNARSFRQRGDVVFANSEPFPFVSVRFGKNRIEIQKGELEDKD